MNANTLVLIGIAWYTGMCLVFSYELNLGKALYFAGAAILTVGVYIME